MRHGAGRVERVLRALGSNVRCGPQRLSGFLNLKSEISLYIGSASCKLLSFIAYNIIAAPIVAF
jgi:hypothetical protein